MLYDLECKKECCWTKLWQSGNINVLSLDHPFLHSSCSFCPSIQNHWGRAGGFAAAGLEWWERERKTASMLARHNVQGCRPRYVRYDRAVTVKVWDSCNLPIPIEGFAQRGILDHFMPKESSNMISLWLYRHGGRLGELLAFVDSVSASLGAELAFTRRRVGDRPTDAWTTTQTARCGAIRRLKSGWVWDRGVRIKDLWIDLKPFFVMTS